MKYKNIIYLIVGIGIVLGSFFGVVPGLLVDTAMLTKHVSPDVSSSRGFFLFMSFYGYASVLTLVVIVVYTVLGRVIKKNRFEKMVRLEIFSNGCGSVDRACLRKLSGLVEEELLKLFPDTRNSFTFEDYLRACQFAKGLGVRPRDDASHLFRI